MKSVFVFLTSIVFSLSARAETKYDCTATHGDRKLGEETLQLKNGDAQFVVSFDDSAFFLSLHQKSKRVMEASVLARFNKERHVFSFVAPSQLVSTSVHIMEYPEFPVRVSCLKK